jgi:uncharacterized protein (TIGR02099 family)
MKAVIIKSLLALAFTSLALLMIADGLLHGWVVPNINNWRPRIEVYLSERIGHTVKIGHIKAESTGLIPSFDLERVQVLDASNVPALELGRVQVAISPLSLLTLELDRLTIDSPTLAISRNAAGVLTVAGFEMNPEATSSKASDWVFSQKEITIKNGTINWIDAKSHLFGTSAALHSATLSNVALSLKNGLRSHNISLQATPPLAFGQSFEVIGTFTQALFDPHPGHWQAWTGNATANIKNIPQFAKQLNAKWDWPLQNASLDGEHITLARLPQILESFGQKLPTQFPSDVLHATQISHLKLEAKGLSSDKLQVRFDSALANPDIAGDIKGSWKLDGNKLDARAQIKSIQLAALHRYVPEGLASNLRQRLKNSIQAGTAQDVRLAFKGSPDDLLKADELRATGRVVSGQFTLPTTANAPSNPWTYWVKTQFWFDLNDSQLELKNIRTELAGLAAKGFVSIADIKNPMIEANAQLDGTFEKLLAIFKVEPLQSITSNALAATEGTGNVSAALQLSLPMSASAANKISGYIQFKNNDLSLGAGAPPLTQLMGKVLFSPVGYQLERIHGKALGGDFELSGNAQKLIGSGTVTSEGLAAWPVMRKGAPITSAIHGSTPYSFVYEPHIGGAGLTLEASLVGMQIDLPAPLAKPAATALPIRFSQIKDSVTQDHMTFHFGNFLSAQYVRELSSAKDSGGAKVVRGHIALGADLPLDLPERGVNAKVRFEQLDIDSWRPFVTDNFANSNAATPSDLIGYLPTQMAAEVSSLKAGNRTFDHIVLGLSKLGSTWRINAEATDFSGYAEYRTSAGEQEGQLYARLKRLTIPDTGSRSQIEQLLEDAPPSALPALDLVVEDFELVGKKLGRLEVNAVNQRAQGFLGTGTAQEWRVQKLNLSNPDAQLQATGVWTPSSASNAKRRVDVQFNFDVNDSGSLLERFGQTGTLKDGKGNLQGRIAWVGSPLALHYPTLTGQLKLGVDKGQFLKINPGGAGRFMNVLSLQSLPKLLTLDFRDIFSEGFAFDSITGDAQVVEGVLSSNNLQMKSSLALVSMEGRVDLANETQNLHVLLLPDLNAGGASLLATLINPVVGAAAYLAQLILRRPVVAAATREFNIDGSWREPKVIQVKK